MLVFVGDTTPLVIYITDEAEVAVDLSDVASTTMSYKRGEGDIVELTGTATDGLNGELTYTVNEGDFTLAGMFVYDIKVTYNDSTKQTLGKASIQIENTVSSA